MLQAVYPSRRRDVFALDIGRSRGRSDIAGRSHTARPFYG